MSKTIYSTTLYELNQVTPTVRELKIRIEEPGPMKFRAGQFVMLQVPVEGQEKPVLRAYSIASSAENDRGFNLLFKHAPGGVASEFVAKLKGGETLNFTGPWGKCFFKEPVPQQVIFVCTGSGLSQHLSFLFTEAPKYPDTQFRMLIGVGNEQEVFYDKEIQEVAKRIKNFEYHWCVSRPTDSWKGYRGRVTAFIGNYDYKTTPTHVYLCGRTEMVKDVKRFLIDENSFPKENLIIENFG